MNALAKVKTVAILRHITPAEILPVGEVLAQAGFDVIEVTLNTEGALEMIEMLAKRGFDGVIVGAGTVTRPEQVPEVASAGGRVAISPDTNPDVILAAKDAGLMSMPGCATPSECFSALRAGADGLKLFPCEVLQPKGVRAIKAVLPPEVPIFAVGDVSNETYDSFIAAGATGVGVGGAVYKPGRSLDEVAKLASQLVAAARAA